MDTKVTATLHDGSKVSGKLTTNHAASSYGQAVFVSDDGLALDWWQIAGISTAAELGRKGGQSTSERKAAAARENGKRGGRPRKDKQSK